MENNNEENNLDSLIASQPQSENSSEAAFNQPLSSSDEKADILNQQVLPAEQDITESSVVDVSSSVAQNRPKLKKIKRLKIRPVSDLPVAPAKVEADINEHTTSEDSSQDDFIENSQGTSLIASADAQGIVSDTDFENSYVLEGLPPELDYITGDDGEAIYPETGLMSYKKPLIIALSCFIIGIFLGAIFFSKKTEEHHGLEGVVFNPDVPQGRARCGLTDKTQACIFYLMNCYKQELTGRDFFKLAATLTGREEYMIETENLRYATMKIKPGSFAQLNIPALK